MHKIRDLLWPVALACGLQLLPLVARAGDIFDFIPSGGRTLLATALGAKPAPEALRAVLSARRDRNAWLAYLRGQPKDLPGMRGFSEREFATLADYLAFNLPLAADFSSATWANRLPPDGRDLALDYCQNCHVITVVVTQDKSREAWLGTMHKPSHKEVKLTEAQREALAAYLVVNAAIPVDQVPEDLRVGGASY